jgi:hypothetical protein
MLAVDGGVHTLDNPVDSISSHYKRVMLEDTVNVEALHFNTLKLSKFILTALHINR